MKVGDSLSAKPAEAYKMVLTNPPFGKKTSVTVISEEGERTKESLVIRRVDSLNQLTTTLPSPLLGRA
ncbi:MAG: hypothetical protein ACRD3O_09645 [Terriglobia bacterium]